MFYYHIDLVSVFHVEVFGGLVLMKACAVEKEADVAGFELSKREVTV